MFRWSCEGGTPWWICALIRRSNSGLLWCLSGKESTCQCRRCKFNPWVRKIPWRRKWQPTPVFVPGKSHRQKILAGYSPWGRRVRHYLAAKPPPPPWSSKLVCPVYRCMSGEGDASGPFILSALMSVSQWHFPHCLGSGGCKNEQLRWGPHPQGFTASVTENPGPILMYYTWESELAPSFWSTSCPSVSKSANCSFCLTR